METSLVGLEALDGYEVQLNAEGCPGRCEPGAAPEESEVEGSDFTGTAYGYARVSSRDQNLDRQIDALVEWGIPERRVFADKASGKDFKRPRYKALMRKLQEGDVVVIKSIDRLGRNYEEILEEWRHITKKRKAAIVVLDMPLLDTRVTKGNLTGVFIADIMLQLLSYIAQIERENTRQRQAEGIAAAKARGVKFGRPKIEKPPSYYRIKRAYLAGYMTRREAAEYLGVSRSTFDKWVKE